MSSFFNLPQVRLTLNSIYYNIFREHFALIGLLKGEVVWMKW